MFARGCHLSFCSPISLKLPLLILSCVCTPPASLSLFRGANPSQDRTGSLCLVLWEHNNSRVVHSPSLRERKSKAEEGTLTYKMRGTYIQERGGGDGDPHSALMAGIYIYIDVCNVGSQRGQSRKSVETSTVSVIASAQLAHLRFPADSPPRSGSNIHLKWFWLAQIWVPTRSSFDRTV